MKIATWNIGSAILEDVQTSISYIADIVEKNSIDILCIQEVITSGDDIDYISELKKRLSFDYSECYELSSAHLNDCRKSGVAILSKFKIINVFKEKFINPNITYEKKVKR